MIDHDVHLRLAKLVQDLTDKKHLALEPTLLRQFKFLCKGTDENITIAFELLLDRLKTGHARVRLLAVELCHELFMRSHIFRGLIADRFSRFLELSVGHRTNNPLPGPQEVAVQLREFSLECIETWTIRFGSLYRQVEMGHHYLKHTLNFEFPELAARAAAAEAETRARETRQRQLLEEKYRQLQADFPSFQSATVDLLSQLERCFQLLEGRNAADMAKPSSQEAAAADNDEDWEDVGSGPADQDDAAREGLAAYTDQALPDDLLRVGPGLHIQIRDPVLLENLEGLHRQLQGATLAKLQDWLKTLVKVNVGSVSSPEHAAKEQLMRAALDIRSKLTSASERYTDAQAQLEELENAAADPSINPIDNTDPSGSSVDPHASMRSSNTDLSSGKHPRDRSAQQSADHAGSSNRRQGDVAAAGRAAAAPASLADLFGSSDEEDTSPTDPPQTNGAHQDALRDVSATVLRKHQTKPAASSLHHSATQDSSNAAAQAHLKQAKQQSAGGTPCDIRKGTEGEKSEQLQQEGEADAWPTYEGSAEEAAAAGDDAWPEYQGSDSEGDAPLGTRQHPPTLDPKPAAHLDESSKAASHAQPSNDAKRKSTLPDSIKQQLLKQAPVIPGGSHLTYWDSDKAGMMVDPRALEISNHWGPVDAQAELPAERLAERFGMMASYVTPSAPKVATTNIKALPRKSGGSQAGASSSNTRPSRQNRNAAAESASQALPAQASGLPTAAGRRAQRTADRAHNDAVLSAAGNDEMLARSLADADAQEAQQRQAANQTRRGTKRKPTVRERLTKKLLSKRTSELANEEAGAVEEERIRDRTANAF